ncbi:MAG TPA: hypothetical protein VG271_08930 [Beijerinckiaceae bacterium]|nr:hypothetical protein [Beijerinckiaceae bacterium]
MGNSVEDTFATNLETGFAVAAAFANQVAKSAVANAANISKDFVDKSFTGFAVGAAAETQYEEAIARGLPGNIALEQAGIAGL